MPNTVSPSDDADTPKDINAIPIIVPAKAEKVVQATLENNGAGNSPANKENSGNDSISWMIQPNRPEDAHKDFAKIASSSVEKQPDVSLPAASSLARPNDSNVPTIQNRAESVGTSSKDFFVQLADRIQVQLRDGNREIRIQLQPDSLGHLEIRAETTVNGVVAKIIAESGSVKNYLETNLHVLQQSLHEQGLKVGRIEVSVQDNTGSDSFSGYAAQSGYTGPGHHGKDPGRSPELSGRPGVRNPEEPAGDTPIWIALNPNTRFHTVA